jgi:hypothetical protein
MDETEYTKLKERLRHDFAREPLIWGDASRVITGESVVLNNAVINVASGTVTIEDFAFLGHNVSLLTGTHDYNQLNRDRQTSVPLTGRNIVINFRPMYDRSSFSCLRRKFSIRGCSRIYHCCREPSQANSISFLFKRTFY